MKHTIFRGFHAGIPPVFRPQKLEEREGNTYSLYLNYRVDYTLGWAYNLVGDDQWDMNKVCGAKYKFFKPQFFNAMWAVRFNPEKGLLEHSPYMDWKGKNHWNDSRDGAMMYETSHTDRVYYSIALHFRMLQIPDEWQLKSSIFAINGEELPLMHKPINVVLRGNRIFWHIGPWFGGQKRAPQKLKLEIRR